MQLINGRTPEQWRAFDRVKLIVALALVALLVVLWMAGLGPGRAAACCGVPEATPAAPPPPAPSDATAEPPAPPAPAQETAAETTAPPAPPAEDDCPRTIDADVAFASNTATLTAAGRDLLGDLAHCLDEGSFEVAGHADSSGNDAINAPLAEARARAVVDFLVARGVDAGRLSARGYGSTRPVADNATPEGRAKNRRVEIHPR
jgi:outer membrane protein OmpA-like peptidoglycan-associated protein